MISKIHPFEGVTPVLRLLSGSHVYESTPKDIQVNGDEVTVVYNWRNRIEPGDHHRLTINIVDATGSIIAKTTISYKKLFRGETSAEWRAIEPSGRIMVELTAVNFGKIGKFCTNYLILFHLLMGF